jgi:DNA-binding PadR family transcriptional regulator
MTTDIDRFLPLTPLAFEVLLAVAEGGRNGYEIMVSVEERTNGAFSPNPGTLYRVLDRLLSEGLIAATDSEAANKETRRIYRLSKLGIRVLDAETRRLQDQVRAATRLLPKRT